MLNVSIVKTELDQAKRMNDLERENEHEVYVVVLIIGGRFDLPAKDNVVGIDRSPDDIRDPCSFFAVRTTGS